MLCFWAQIRNEENETLDAYFFLKNSHFIMPLYHLQCEMGQKQIYGDWIEGRKGYS